MEGEQIKHYFKCSNGNLTFELPNVHTAQMQLLEGKKGYVVYTIEEEKITPNQRAFYYGGIIRGECMSSDAFKGFHSVEAISDYLVSELRTYVNIISYPDGTEKPIKVRDDISKYNIKQFAAYIEEVIAFLLTEFNIEVKPPEFYKTKCRIIKRNK
jgi:hypothetical protein